MTKAMHTATRTTRLIGRTLLAALLATTAAARATSIRDLAHLQGARENKLMAVAMVVGLKGTGDGKSLYALQSLKELFSRMGHSVGDLRSINADNVALVHVSATVGPQGARDGDKLDVKVASINGAKSLVGGRLIQCAMLGPMALSKTVFALAAGDLIVQDTDNPTTAVIKGGAIVEQDIVPNFVQGGKITLVLDGNHATWAVASTLAKVVNDAEAEPGDDLAVATGPGMVSVRIPTPELGAPADFIARVLSLPVLMPDLKARIVVSRKTGTIVITGDVEIDPVIFSQRGLTITTMSPQPVATPETPKITTGRFQAFSAGDRPSKAGVNVRQLLDAFNQLQVPVEDQIAVIYALKSSGRLHAEVVEE